MKMTPEEIRKRNKTIIQDYNFYINQGKGSWESIKILAKTHKVTPARIDQIIKAKKLQNKVKVKKERARVIGKTPLFEAQYESINHTTIKIDGMVDLVVKGDKVNVYNFIKKAFMTPLDQLKEEVNKLTDSDATMLLDVMRQMDFWAGKPKGKKNKSKVMPKETPKIEEELDNEPSEDDRMQGISFGGT